MSIIVWKGIHNDKRMFSGVQDKRFRIIFLFKSMAKDTIIRLFTEDIFYSPWSPNGFHILANDYWSLLMVYVRYYLIHDT